MTKIIDLYSGVGGFTLGCARAGFDVSLAIDLDELAFQYHAKNFPNSTHAKIDVALLDGSMLRQMGNIKPRDFFGIVGGPPCQGFSTSGRSDVNDPRNQQFLHFFRLISEAFPDFFVVENVPGILRERYESIVQAALNKVDDYDIIGPVLVAANDLGAPTIRQRVFIVGIRRDHRVSGLTASQLVTKPGIERVVVREALRGLKTNVKESWQTERQSWRKVDEFEPTIFLDKVINDIPRGVGDLYSIQQLRQKQLVSGFLGTVHSKDVVERFAALKGGQMDAISRCQRLDQNGYCPTLRAGTSSDKGSHQALRPIHPTRSRVITPREAARLQGFPDWFQFHPTKWHSFRQIGNSVSPIVSEHVMRCVANALGIIR